MIIRQRFFAQVGLNWNLCPVDCDKTKCSYLTIDPSSIQNMSMYGVAKNVEHTVWKEEQFNSGNMLYLHGLWTVRLSGVVMLAAT